MKKKINVAELLRDCPKGMELDCINYNGVVTFEEIFNCPNYPIKISVKYNNEYFTHTLTKYGQTCESPYNKCVIFPKGKTTWEGFCRPFKGGDIVFYNDTIAIFKEWGGETLFRTYVTKYLCCDSLIDINVPLFGKSVRKEIRYATEEEKEKLFQAIKDNGYRWNSETKNLEKLLRFKVGNRIKQIGFPQCYIIKTIEFDRYILDNNKFVSFEDEHLYELVPNKFDISTLKPFESRVLVRSANDKTWRPSLFGCYRENNYEPFYVLGGIGWRQCIPYEGNEHLLGTSNDCADFYKTW